MSSFLTRVELGQRQRQRQKEECVSTVKSTLCDYESIFLLFKNSLKTINSKPESVY